MNENIPEEVLAKEDHAKQALARYKRVAIAYSGGLDSSYLADVAHEALGANAHLVMADSPLVPRAELAEATGLAKERHWKLAVIAGPQFQNEAFVRNDEKRCYHCKKELFARMKQYALEHNLAVLAHGETAEDASDPRRLGNIAAHENGVVAPLRDAGLIKDEIRQLSARRKLPTWNKAPFACLATRLPTGVRLCCDDLAKVEAAEEVLRGLGFRQYRARHHDTLCRIEVDPEGFAKLLEGDVRDQVVKQIAGCGYRYVTIDLAGYRSGSMNAP